LNNLHINYLHNTFLEKEEEIVHYSLSLTHSPSPFHLLHAGLSLVHSNSINSSYNRV
jgi:hypothetical protein